MSGRLLGRSYEMESARARLGDAILCKARTDMAGANEYCEAGGHTLHGAADALQHTSMGNDDSLPRCDICRWSKDLRDLHLPRNIWVPPVQQAHQFHPAERLDRFRRWREYRGG